MKTIYRAIRIDGFIHGGGGSHFNHWRRSYKAANRDLEEMTAAYDDSFGCVEALQASEADAWRLLHPKPKGKQP